MYIREATLEEPGHDGIHKRVMEQITTSTTWSALGSMQRLPGGTANA